MNSVEHTNLSCAKEEFVLLLSKLHLGERKDFLDWIYDTHHMHAASVQSGGTSHNMSDHAEEVLQQPCAPIIYPWLPNPLKPIIQDLRTRLPLSGICESEKMFTPKTGQNSDYDPSTTVVIDAFLYDDDDVDDLCDDDQVKRNYCQNCGSLNTMPLTFISHSLSVNHIKFIFASILPNLLTNMSCTSTLVDVGSRLGAVLYGAYYFSQIAKIIGVEMNTELCHIQNEIINKYGLGNRIQTICDDVCKVSQVLHEADVIILNNTFEFFLPEDAQIRTWQNMRANICKPGCIVITVPSIEESVCLGDGQQPILDIESWLVPLNVGPIKFGLNYFEVDVEEVSRIHFYKVK